MTSARVLALVISRNALFKTTTLTSSGKEVQVEDRENMEAFPVKVSMPVNYYLRATTNLVKLELRGESAM